MYEYIDIDTQTVLRKEGSSKILSEKYKCYFKNEKLPIAKDIKYDSKKKKRVDMVVGKIFVTYRES